MPNVLIWMLIAALVSVTSYDLGLQHGSRLARAQQERVEPMVYEPTPEFAEFLNSISGE